MMGCGYMARVNSTGRTDSSTHPNCSKQSKAPLVLCIDDNEMILEVLEEILKARGLRILCAADGFSGIHLAKSEPVDLIVLDYEMPKMDGLHLARELRNCRPGVPLIMFSGSLPSNEVEETVSKIIRKGDGVFSLADAIHEVLGAK
ncbi:MAG TPA: response regulator [Terriglobales bacterium]|jgi:CheY-like chemotaxis protein|nr:response regulator [Terriglobales bacterium]